MAEYNTSKSSSLYIVRRKWEALSKDSSKQPATCTLMCEIGDKPSDITVSDNSECTGQTSVATNGAERTCKPCEHTSNEDGYDDKLSDSADAGIYTTSTSRSILPMRSSTCLQTCPNHKQNSRLIDHICKDVCAKCARRNHSNCKTDAIVNVCVDINVMDELKRFKRAILNFKETMLSVKENLDTCLQMILKCRAKTFYKRHARCLHHKRSKISEL